MKEKMHSTQHTNQANGERKKTAANELIDEI